jgi:hypothetical protein
MPHVYGAVDGLLGKPRTGAGDCVELVKEFAPGLKGKPTHVATGREGQGSRRFEAGHGDRTPDGWRGYSPSPMKLTGFGMMGGDPQSMAYLIPEASNKAKSGGKITWRHGGEMWLFCTYDDSSAIRISKRLDGGASCTARYTKKDGVIVAMRIACR